MSVIAVAAPGDITQIAVVPGIAMMNNMEAASRSTHCWNTVTVDSELFGSAEDVPRI